MTLVMRSSPFWSYAKNLIYELPGARDHTLVKVAVRALLAANDDKESCQIEFVGIERVAVIFEFGRGKTIS